MSPRRLFFLVHCGKDYTFRHYFKTWGAAIADRVQIRTYPGIGNAGRTFSKRLKRRLRSWKTGTLRAGGRASTGPFYVFTDLEILRPDEKRAVSRLRDELAGLAQTVAVLNDPNASRTRLELLRALHGEGINSFNAYPAEAVFEGVEDDAPQRWPVFTRDDRSHDDDSASGLLESHAELRARLSEIVASGGSLRHRSVVEYAGTPDPDGVFRKYAAMRLGDAIVPCHIFFGRQWMVKHSSISDAATAREELEYIEANPHAEVLRRVFDLAGIEYGRVDYGVVDGRVEVWEINTNPYVIRPQYTHQQERHEALRAFSGRFNEAVRVLLDV